MDAKAAEQLNQAATLHARGDLDKAMKTVKAVASRFPDHPVVQQFLGVLYCQSGRVDQGARHLERALRADPSSENVRFNLAQALIDSGRTAEAAAICQDPSANAPDFLRLRAEIAKAQGQGAEALALYRQLTERQPADPAAWNNLGNLHAELGERDQAVAALQRARQLDPRSPVVAANLGRVLHSMRRSDESRAMFEQALQLGLSDPAALVEIGDLLRRLDQPQLALKAFSSAARLNPKDPQVFVAIGQSFAAIPDRAQAEQAYRMALHVDPRCAAAYLNLAIVLEQENRTEELRETADRARRNGVSGGEYNYISALVSRREEDFDRALDLARSAVSDSLDPAVQAHFVGQLADRVGDSQSAFAAFQQMNQLIATSPAGELFTGEEHRREVEQMNASTTAQYYAGWTDARPDPEPQSPAFLMGFLRSGTTLLDTMLMGHPGTYVLEEDPLLARVERAGGSLDQLPTLSQEEIQALRDRYFQELAANGHQPGDKLVIDKNPLAALRAPLIHRIFPDARFIFALRHPCDVVLSCYMQNFRASQSMASFFDLTNAARFYDSVMSHWMKCRSVMPLDIHTIRYEDMVEDVEGEMRPLLGYLGLDWDPAVLDHRKTASERGYIRTPSYAQVTEQIYRRSTGRWTRYRDQMADVLPILAPWAEEFGYGME